MGHSQLMEEMLNDALAYFNIAVNEMKRQQFSRAVDSFRKTRNALIEVRYWAKEIEDKNLIMATEQKLRELELNKEFCQKRCMSVGIDGEIGL